jgi:hypothetical protein
LAESVLALPVLVLLMLGLLMFGHLLWLRVRLQAAAQAAARAYSVWEPENAALALRKAEAAAWLAMRPQPRGASLTVTLPPLKLRSSHDADDHRRWLQGPLAHRLDVDLRLRPLPGTRWIWPQGLTLRAPAAILSENTIERDKLLR